MFSVRIAKADSSVSGSSLNASTRRARGENEKNFSNKKQIEATALASPQSAG